MSGTWCEFAAAIGRCQSTPGLVESRGRVSLEDMWISPLDYKTHAYSTAASLFSPSPSPTSRRTMPGLGDANVPRGAESPMSAASSGPSSEDQTARAPQSAATQPSTHSGEFPFDLSLSLSRAVYVTLFPNTWLFSKMYPSCLSQKELRRVSGRGFFSFPVSLYAGNSVFDTRAFVYHKPWLNPLTVLSVTDVTTALLFVKIWWLKAKDNNITL